MSDYIKREDAIKALEGWKISGEMILATVPSADVVEVVRCKNCKFRYYDNERDLFYCQKYYGMGDVRDENFCSYGERAEE